MGCVTSIEAVLAAELKSVRVNSPKLQNVCYKQQNIRVPFADCFKPLCWGKLHFQTSNGDNGDIYYSHCTKCSAYSALQECLLCTEYTQYSSATNKSGIERDRMKTCMYTCTNNTIVAR